MLITSRRTSVGLQNWQGVGKLGKKRRLMGLIFCLYVHYILPNVKMLENITCRFSSFWENHFLYKQLSLSLSLVLYAFIHVYVCMLNNDRLWIYGQVNFSSGRYFSDGNDIGSRLPFDAGFEVHDNNIINLWCNCLIQICRFARPIMLCCL